MKRKTLISGILMMATCFALSFSLSGCNQEQKSTDEQFMESLASGLEARWSTYDNEGDNSTQEDLDAALKKEKEAVSPYRDADFENDELKSHVDEYLGALDELNASDAFSAAGYEKWSRSYNARVAALYKIDQLSKIEVGESSQDELDEILYDGKAASGAIEIMQQAKFKAEKPEYEGQTWTECTATVENTTGIDFSFFQFTINLVDKDGVTVETTYATTDDWTAGSKHKFQFTTDEKYKTIEISSVGWNL